MAVSLPGEPGFFNAYSRHLRARYGRSVYRVSVDAGFTCPHRERSPLHEGCSFCDGPGARAPYLGNLERLDDQVQRGVTFLRRRYRAELFILYFQAFTNTYAEPETLRKIYDRGLEAQDFVGLVVSTRPDCVDEARAGLLASYISENRDVWVELGLQSSHDRSLDRVGRGHDYAAFLKAYRILRDRGISVAVHLVFGLPGETEEDLRLTLDRVAGLRPAGVKIHNLHIPKASPLARELLAGEVTVPCFERHLGYVVEALEQLPEETVILRLLCDTPPGRLGAPKAPWDKARFYQAVTEELRRRGSWQGSHFQS